MRTIRLARPSATQGKAFLYYLFVVGAPITVFLWHLQSQTIGLGPAEALTRSASKLSSIKMDAVNLPYKLLEDALYHSGLSHALALRLGSVIVGMLAVAAYFHVLRGWFGKPIALLTVLLFALTPLYLLASRVADGSIMLVSPIFLLFAYYCIGHLKNPLLRAALVLLALLLCLYTPGVIWLMVVAGIYWRQKVLAAIAHPSSRAKLSFLLILIILLVPLFYSFLTNSASLREWLSLPADIPGPLELVKNFAWGISDLLVRTHAGADLNVGNVPVLNAVQIGLLLFGVYVTWTRLKGVLYWMGVSALVVMLMMSLNPRLEQLLLVLPFAAFLSGMGLRYLFLEWRSVFPKNPLAKAFAITLMSAIVLMHCLYGIRYSLTAWPATPHVRQTYVLK